MSLPRHGGPGARSAPRSLQIGRRRVKVCRSVREVLRTRCGPGRPALRDYLPDCESVCSRERIVSAGASGSEGTTTSPSNSSPIFQPGTMLATLRLDWTLVTLTLATSLLL